MKTAFVAAFAVGFSCSAYAAQLTGQVKAASVPILERSLGYTKTRIMAASDFLRNKKEDLALYLEVKNSLPLKPSTERRVVTIHGLSFSPSITSCVVDEVIVFSNQDRAPRTVSIRGQLLGTIETKDELTYKCETKGLGEVRLKEWKHAHANIFVGTTGVATRPDENGFFTLFAPTGTYDLKVINASGVIHTSPVEIGTEDIDLGLLGAEQTVDESAPDEEASIEEASEKPPPPGPAIVTPPPVAIPTPAARPAPVTTRPSVAPVSPKASTPVPKKAVAPAVAPKLKLAPPTAKPPPAPKPAAKPAPPVAKPPPPKPKPKPEAEEEESLDDFFDMEE